MTKRVSITLGTNPYVKAGLGNPVGVKRLQEQAKESETAPTVTVGSSIRTSSCTIIRYMQRT